MLDAAFFTLLILSTNGHQLSFIVKVEETTPSLITRNWNHLDRWFYNVWQPLHVGRKRRRPLYVETRRCGAIITRLRMGSRCLLRFNIFVQCFTSFVLTAFIVVPVITGLALLLLTLFCFIFALIKWWSYNDFSCC